MIFVRFSTFEANKLPLAEKQLQNSELKEYITPKSPGTYPTINRIWGFPVPAVCSQLLSQPVWVPAKLQQLASTQNNQHWPDFQCIYICWACLMRIAGLPSGGGLFCLRKFWGSLTQKLAAGWLLEGAENNL